MGKTHLVGKTHGWLALFKVGHWKNPYFCWENLQEKPIPHLGKPVLCTWLLLRLQSTVHLLIVESVAISASRSGKNLFKEKPFAFSSVLVGVGIPFLVFYQLVL